MRWLVLVLFAQGIARADVTITPSIARADGPGLAIEVTPVLPEQRHLLDVDGNSMPACAPNLEDDGCVPVLPYGTMYVAITNKTALPIVVAPEELTLVVRGVRYRVLGSAAAVEKRWHDFVPERIHGDDPRQQLHDLVPIMKGPLRIAPRSVMRGYVVFDYKESLRSDYEDFLENAGQIFVVLQSRAEKLTATFVAR